MFSNYLPGIRQDVVQYGYPASHLHNYVSDGADDTTLWYNSPSRFDPSSPNHLHNSFESTYKFYTCSTQANYFPQQHATTNPDILTHSSGSYIRVIKRRTTANKKERKRTNSINKAFFFLRNCIPNVPADTKLSKIKTLRLATSYISYLTRALETDETLAGFEVELGKISRKSNCNPFHVGCSTDELFSPKSVTKEESSDSKRSNERTGWPQHVWDSELKQEQPL